MKEPWQPYLQLGVVHNMAFPECLAGDGPQFDTLKEICYDAFFEAVDVGPMNDAAQRRDCASLLRDCQMTRRRSPASRRSCGTSSTSTPPTRLSGRKPCGWSADLFDQAKELGAEPHRPHERQERRRFARGPWSASSIRCGNCRRLAQERAGLPLVLEIFDYDMDKKALVGTCTVAAAVAQAVRRDFPDFGLLHDLSHIYLCHEEPAQHFPLIREYLVAVHMGSSVSDREHPSTAIPIPCSACPAATTTCRSCAPSSRRCLTSAT